MDSAYCHDLPRLGSRDDVDVHISERKMIPLSEAMHSATSRVTVRSRV